MHPETVAFLHGVFGHCTQGYLTLTAIHPAGERPTPSRHVALTDTAALRDSIDCLLTANRAGWGAYVSVATRRSDLGRWHRGCKRDLVELPALFIDIDQPTPAVMQKLGIFPLPPSCIVSSGRGYHVYWLLNPPTRDFRTADRTLRGLARYFESDSQMTVAQSLRLVGTMNTKPNRGTLCQMLTFYPDRGYTLTDFAAYAEPLHSLNDTKHHFRCSATREMVGKNRVEDTKRVLAERVVQLLDGHVKQNGFIAALCPYPHNRDRPGLHFNHHLASGTGHCFGIHGHIDLLQMCQLLGVGV